MLELTQEQLDTLRQHEHTAFVSRVKDEIAAQFPDAASPRLRDQLLQAHDRALQLGLESTEARTQFLYQAAFAPGFYDLPAITHWLSQPGATVEQRWRDFLALATARIEER